MRNSPSRFRRSIKWELLRARLDQLRELSAKDMRKRSAKLLLNLLLPKLQYIR